MSAAALALAIVALGTSLLAALLSVGALLRVQRMERGPTTVPGLVTGSEAPLQTLGGHGAATDRALAEREQFIVFLSSACGPCRDAVEALNNEDVRGRLPAGLILVEVGGADGSGLRGLATFSAAWLVDDGTVAKAFAVRAFPFAYLVTDGRVSDAGLANSMIRAAQPMSVEAGAAPRPSW